MKFNDWFDESEHDFVNYPDECMLDCWNKATQEKDKEIAELKANYQEAIEDISFWGEYASDYFKNKHDLDGCINRHNKLIKEVKGE